MQQQREREKQSNKQYRVVGKTTILHIDKGGTPDFKWQGCLNGGKNQNPKKSLGLQTKPQKIPGPKFNPPPKSHAKFLSHKNFQKALNDITQKIETLVLNLPQKLNQATQKITC